jgi:riboflavin synthase
MEELMFTGLVETTGMLESRSVRGGGMRMSIRARFDGEPLVLGESIAVDGVCLSVDAVRIDGFEADASTETCARTTLGSLEQGATLHLERALRVGDRLGGHLVTGHVDGIGALANRRPAGEAVWMVFVAPPALMRFLAEKGSVTVDGVSLTVNGISVDGFEVMLIPHTCKRTKLGALVPGSRVNLEVDVIARYVQRLMALPG